MPTNPSRPPRRETDSDAAVQALLAGVDTAPLAAHLRRAGGWPDPRTLDLIVTKAASAVAARHSSGGGGRAGPAPALDPGTLAAAKSAVSLPAMRNAAAAMAPDLHPYAIHAALSVELAALVRESISAAKGHGCRICQQCIETAARHTQSEAELAAALTHSR